MKKIIYAFIGIFGGFVIGLIIGFFIVFFTKGITISEFTVKISNIVTLSSIAKLLTIILSLFISYYLQIIIHEGGHLICGILSNYKFVSFRIDSLTLAKIDGKFKLKKFDLAGTGGQCLLDMPDKPIEEIPMMLYNLGGVLANLIISIIAISIFFIFKPGVYIGMFLVVFSFIGFFFAILNGIPMKIQGICNDAKNAIQLKDNIKNKIALRNQLKINALSQEGIRIKDMDEKWFDYENVDYKDSLQAGNAIISASRFIDKKDWDSAYSYFQTFLDNEKQIIGLLVKEAKCEMLFLSLIKEKKEKVEDLYTKEMKQYIQQSKKYMSNKIRLQIAIALFYDKDIVKAQQIYAHFLNIKDKFLMKGEVESDLDIMNDMLFKFQS